MELIQPSLSGEQPSPRANVLEVYTLPRTGLDALAAPSPDGVLGLAIQLSRCLHREVRDGLGCHREPLSASRRVDVGSSGHVATSGSAVQGFISGLRGQPPKRGATDPTPVLSVRGHASPRPQGKFRSTQVTSGGKSRAIERGIRGASHGNAACRSELDRKTRKSGYNPGRYATPARCWKSWIVKGLQRQHEQVVSVRNDEVACSTHVRSTSITRLNTGSSVYLSLWESAAGRRRILGMYPNRHRRPHHADSRAALPLTPLFPQRSGPEVSGTRFRAGARHPKCENVLLEHLHFTSSAFGACLAVARGGRGA
jgi:hypothetical protein